MSEMIERVARVLWEKYPAPLPAWGDLDEELSSQLFIMARAAIAAMREPSDEMVVAAERRVAILAPWRVWRAMIDAALDNSEPTKNP